jgi:hypothetical protein
VFSGWDLPADLCDAPDAVAVGLARGVPMGAGLPPAPAGGGGPGFYVRAEQDPGVPAAPGAPLERVEVVNAWLAADGTLRERVVEVAAAAAPAGPVDPATCAPAEGGAAALCAVWTDPGFDPAVPACWYVRVLEVPTCRWSAWECLSLAGPDRPAACDDGSVPATIQERAWSSPVWYEPGA